MTSDINSDIAVLREKAIARDIEMRDIKQQFNLMNSKFDKMDAKIDEMLEIHNQREGAIKLLKWLVGTGIVGWAVAVWQGLGGKIGST